MNPPKISVLLPVYNAGPFLAEALESVLQQSFGDFELLVLDDGSTDASAEIIASFTDPRIRYLPNDRNRGLVYTLNRGLELAQGTYIARMDADDVCHPERFAAQASFLDQHPEVAVVATFLDMMDEAGAPLPPWNDDRANSTPAEIRECLLRTNCLAHPSVMGRAELLRTYRYRPEQKEAEDYDLWLRLVADGYQLAKVPQPLLRYRVLTSSLTRKEGLSGFERRARTKRIFLQQRRASGTMNAWCRRLQVHYRMDVIRAYLKKWLRR
ncbi:MAG: glycosyltransferase [Chitinophagaceae bacterium]|nr:MAG: glycosyltransferase [Chitinophagaceae bacterium]